MAKEHSRAGFIGLGTMGASMAGNLLAATGALAVSDRRREAAAPLLAGGATWCPTPRSLAERCDVVFLSLPGPSEVEDVALGPEGVLAGLQPGGSCFDLSTNSPAVVRRIHASFAERGAHFLDAPVSGGPRGAETGKLALWIGGDEAIFDRHRATLDAIGDQVRWLGPIGAGTVAKLVHNCAGYVVTVALAEVFTLGVKAGAEPSALFEAIRSGVVGRRRTFDGLADQFLTGTYDPPAFALKLAHKDVRLATELARELGLPMRLANLTFDEMTEARHRGWDALDSRSCMRLQIERAGVDVTVDRDELDRILSDR